MRWRQHDFNSMTIVLGEVEQVLLPDPAQLELSGEIRSHLRRVKGAKRGVQFALFVHFFQTARVRNPPCQRLLQLSQNASAFKKERCAIGAYANLELGDALLIANSPQTALQIEHLADKSGDFLLNDDLVANFLDQRGTDCPLQSPKMHADRRLADTEFQGRPG